MLNVARSATALALALLLVACNKAEPPVADAAQARHPEQKRAQKKVPPRERMEYAGAVDGENLHVDTATTSAAQTVEGEVLRGGPHGELRIFESAQERAALARGASPKYMNGQFRYYLAGISMTPGQDGGCQQPLLTMRLAVENLHGKAAAAIYGTFSFSESRSVDGSSQAMETIGDTYHADIIGPFSDKNGAIVYVNAQLQPTNPSMDAERWSRIVNADQARLRVWFKPEAFYYADGTQYASGSGNGPARREVMTCGGTEGGVKVAGVG
ncbi:MAG: hypothetical protein ABI330_10120 [Caldimonas sp.]|nr:hypothetical protein [Pseudomonadota bacterium]